MLSNEQVLPNAEPKQVYPALSPHLPYVDTGSARVDKTFEKPLDGGFDGTPSTSKDVARTDATEKRNRNDIVKINMENSNRALVGRIIRRLMEISGMTNKQ
jgi:hypothetical protein